MSKHKVGDQIENQDHKVCTVTEVGSDYYLLQTPEGTLENITESELNQL